MSSSVAAGRLHGADETCLLHTRQVAGVSRKVPGEPMAGSVLRMKRWRVSSLGWILGGVSLLRRPDRVSTSQPMLREPGSDHRPSMTIMDLCFGAGRPQCQSLKNPNKSMGGHDSVWSSGSLRQSKDFDDSGSLCLTNPQCAPPSHTPGLPFWCAC